MADNLVQSALAKVRETASQILKPAIQATQDTRGFVQQGRFTPVQGFQQLVAPAVQRIEATIPGGFTGAQQRLQQAVQGQPIQLKSLQTGQVQPVQMPKLFDLGQQLQRFGQVLSPPQLGLQTKQLLTPVIGAERAGQLGYGLQGATSYAPMILGRSELAKQQAKMAAATLPAEIKAEQIGEELPYLIGSGGAGGLLGVGRRALEGAVLGTGLKIGENLITGKQAFADLGQGVEQGALSSWKLAFTNALADKVTSLVPKLAPLGTESLETGKKVLQGAIAMNAPRARDIFLSTSKRLFQRALLETPIENTVFSAVNQLNGTDKRKFVEAWVQDLPATLASNLFFAGLRTGKRAIVDFNKEQIDQAGQAFVRTARRLFTDPEFRKGFVEIPEIPGVPKPTEEGVKPAQAVTQPVTPAQVTPVEIIKPVVEKAPTIKQQVAEETVTLPLNSPNVRAENPSTLEKERKFVTSVKEAPNVKKKVKVLVNGTYIPKPNQELIKETRGLMEEGATVNAEKIPDFDTKVALTIQEALNRQQQGDHQSAANLFNNLAEIGTKLGRGVQAFSLLQKMSPEAISLSAAGQIKKFNATNDAKIPELTGEQQKIISDKVRYAMTLPQGREKNIALKEIENYINDLMPSSLADKAITVWKAGLLTSLRTGERNFISNAIMGLAEIAKDLVSSPVDQVMSLRTGKRTLTFTTEGVGNFGSKSTVQQMKDIITKGFDPSEDVGKFDYRRITWNKNPVEQALKIYTDVVFRVMEASDKPFFNAAFARSLYNQAGAAAINAGKQGDRRFIKSLVESPTTEMLKTATADAMTATFKDKNSATNIGNAVKRELAKIKVELPLTGKKVEIGKIIGEGSIPFVGVPTSALEKFVAYSPFGLLKGVNNVGKVLVKNLPELQRQAAQEIGRGVVGTGLWGLGAYLMQKGLITGQPKDKEEALLWEAQNKPRNSILINGEWKSLNSIGPQTLAILAGAKFQEELGLPEGSYGTALFKLAKDQLDQSYVRGLQGPVNVLTDPGRYAKDYVQQQVSSIVPNFIKDVSKATDTVQRETNTIREALAGSIPGLRQGLLPRRDVYGNALPQEPTGFGSLTDVFNTKKQIQNKILDETQRLYSVGENTVPSKLKTQQTIRGVEGVLTPEQLDQLEQSINIPLTARLNELISSPSYQSLSDAVKAKAIINVTDQVRTEAKKKGPIPMPDEGYVQSADSATGLGRVGLYGESLVTDPGQTIKAVLDGNPIRKVQGGAVILERKKGLSVLDAGDTATQVDHKIALTLGGTNTKDNLQILTNVENQVKGEVEVYLSKLMKEGKITKEEAQKRDLNWRDEVDNLPKSSKARLLQTVSIPNEVSNITGGKTYSIIDSTTGKVTEIDISSPIVEPVSTGFKEIDKINISQYKTALNNRKKDIVALYNDGQITADNASTLLNAIETSIQYAKTKSGKGKKPKKIAFKKLSLKKVKLPKLKAIKVQQIKPIRFAKLKTPTTSRMVKLKTIKVRA